MGTTIRDRISALEHAAFVGRHDERSVFVDLLKALEPSHQVLFLHGPGGVGKTTLLREFRYQCHVAGVLYVFVDGRHTEPTPAGFLQAVAQDLGIALDQVAAHLADFAERVVVFVDSWEWLATLDSWLRRVLLPAMSRHCLVVLAGRDGPGPGWRARAGLQALVRPVSLRNLAPDESRLLLRRRGVPDSQVDEVLAFTRGHPLALALVGDVCAQSPDKTVSASTVVGVVPALLERLLHEVTDERQRDALEAASTVRTLTEPLLAGMLGLESAREVFEWLRSLSCMEVDVAGLRPHELVRDALAADLRWRNPQRAAAYHERARQAYYDRFDGATPGGQREVLADLLFLHRDNPAVAPFFDWDTTGTVATDTLAEDDVEGLVATVAEHEGRSAATIARHWFGRAAARTLVLRDNDHLLGFVTMVAMREVTAQDLSVDPVTATLHRHLDTTGPLRQGEVAILFRSWMAVDTHQAVSPVQGRIFLEAARHYLTTPGLARSYFCCVDGVFWDPTLAYWDVARIPDQELDGGHLGVAVYGHDWRTRPPLAWLQLLADRETSRDVPPPTADLDVVVLSRPDFAQSVRAALGDLQRPDRLVDNPLVRSRMVLDDVGADADAPTRVAHLVGLVHAAVARLDADPRSARGHRAVHHTWIDPAGTQEQTAELLNLPFSTYRRHLGEGLEGVTDLLWLHELGQATGLSASQG